MSSVPPLLKGDTDMTDAPADTPTGAPSDAPTDAPTDVVESGPQSWSRTWTIATALVIAAVAGGAVGWIVADDDKAPVATAPTTTDSTTGPPLPTVPDTLPIGLEPTLRVYLDALVSHDWRVAHDLMCADLADEISAGGLKQELSGSEARAGLLTGYSIGSDLAPAERTAEVEYVLEFEKGSIDITASMETEGASWRVCSFSNTGGTGVFAAA